MSIPFKMSVPFGNPEKSPNRRPRGIEGHGDALPFPEYKHYTVGSKGTPTLTFVLFKEFARQQARMQVTATDDDDSDGSVVAPNVLDHCLQSMILFGQRFSLVSIRVGLKGVWIHDSLVIDELVTFVIGESVELISFRVPHDLVGFDN